MYSFFFLARKKGPLTIVQIDPVCSNNVVSLSRIQISNPFGKVDPPKPRLIICVALKKKKKINALKAQHICTNVPHMGTPGLKGTVIKSGIVKTVDGRRYCRGWSSHKCPRSWRKIDYRGLGQPLSNRRRSLLILLQESIHRPFPCAVSEKILRVCQASNRTCRAVGTSFIAKERRVRAPRWHWRRCRRGGSQNDIIILAQKVDESSANLICTLDVKKGHTWQHVGILERLVELANVIHTAIEQHDLVEVADCGASMRRGKDDDGRIQRLESI